jgi:hypothetical protein
MTRHIQTEATKSLFIELFQACHENSEPLVAELQDVAVGGELPDNLRQMLDQILACGPRGRRGEFYETLSKFNMIFFGQKVQTTETQQLFKDLLEVLNPIPPLIESMSKIPLGHLLDTEALVNLWKENYNLTVLPLKDGKDEKFSEVKTKMEKVFKLPIVQSRDSQSAFEKLSECSVEGHGLAIFSEIQPGDILPYNFRETLVKVLSAGPKTIGGDPTSFFGAQFFVVNLFRIEPKDIYLKQGTAIVQAYLKDLNVIDNDNSYLNLNHNQIEEQYENVAKIVGNDQVILEKAIKVLNKLGKKKLEEISADPTKLGNVTLLEQIGHYVNLLVRKLTFGYVGYEFSDKEAKIIIGNGFFGDKSFTDIVESETTKREIETDEENIVIREETRSVQDPEADYGQSSSYVGYRAQSRSPAGSNLGATSYNGGFFGS